MNGNGQTFCIHNKQDFDSGKFWGILQVLNRIWPKLLACFCPPTKCFWPLTNCWVQNQHHWERHSCSFLFAKLSNNIWKFESQTFFFALTFPFNVTLFSKHLFICPPYVNAKDKQLSVFVFVCVSVFVFVFVCIFQQSTICNLHIWQLHSRILNALKLNRSAICLARPCRLQWQWWWLW